MVLNLSQAHAALLKDVLTIHRPDLLDFVTSPGVRHLDDATRDQIREAIADEMMSTGLEGPKSAAKLSSRGRALDNLIGAIAQA